MYTHSEFRDATAQCRKIRKGLVAVLVVSIASIFYLSASLLTEKANAKKEFDWVSVIAAINYIEVPLGLTEKEQALIALKRELQLMLSEAKVNESFTMVASKKFDGIKKGISREKVISILGEPDYINNEKDYSSHTELWLYGTSRSKWASGTSSVTFKKNKLYRWDLERRR